MTQRYHMLLEGLETKNLEFLQSICDQDLGEKIAEGIEKYPIVKRQGDREMSRIELISARLDLGLVPGL